MEYLKEIFEQSYSIDKVTNCWNWNGNLNWCGYGELRKRINKKSYRIRAHRFSFELNFGKLGNKTRIFQACHNKKCVNPEHLKVKECFGAERKPVKERFECSYKKDEKSRCWNWIKDLDKKGYGQIHDYKNGKRVTRAAHRVSYEINKGEIPQGMIVCHSCDNRKCVNPNHLWIGTTQDNINDKLKKNRGLYGSKHQNSKLTEEDVLEIRASSEKKAHLARKYKVSFMVITSILRRNTWKHI